MCEIQRTCDSGARGFNTCFLSGVIVESSNRPRIRREGGILCFIVISSSRGSSIWVIVRIGVGIINCISILRGRLL